jgi:hypothetical protein
VASRSCATAHRHFDDRPLPKSGFEQAVSGFVQAPTVSFSLTGLPMDVPKMDHLLEMFHFAKEQLRVKFQQLVADESWMLLARAMQEKGTSSTCRSSPSAEN